MTRIEKVESPDGLEWPSDKEVKQAARQQAKRSGFSPSQLLASLAISTAAAFGLPQLYVQHPDNLVAETLRPHTWSEEIETFAQNELSREQIVGTWQRTATHLNGLYANQSWRGQNVLRNREPVVTFGDDLYQPEPRLNLSIKPKSAD